MFVLLTPNGILHKLQLLDSHCISVKLREHIRQVDMQHHHVPGSRRRLEILTTGQIDLIFDAQEVRRADDLENHYAFLQLGIAVLAFKLLNNFSCLIKVLLRIHIFQDAIQHQRKVHRAMEQQQRFSESFGNLHIACMSVIDFTKTCQVPLFAILHSQAGEQIHDVIRVLEQHQLLCGLRLCQIAIKCDKDSFNE
jgi:hypothetical protein